MVKIPRVPVENQIITLSVVKIAIKFSPGMHHDSNSRVKKRERLAESRAYNPIRDSRRDCLELKVSPIDSPKVSEKVLAKLSARLFLRFVFFSRGKAQLFYILYYIRCITYFLPSFSSS